MKMKKLLKPIAYLFLAFIWIGCGNADDDVFFNINNGELGLGQPVDDCLNFGDDDLVLSIQEQFTSLPGKVSILFKVSDKFGNPVAGLSASQFTIYEQGRNDDCFNTISSNESFARISPNSQIFSNSTLLVLDLSNSVLANSLNELKSASIGFVNSVMPQLPSDTFKMAIYWFDGEDILHELNPLSSDKATLIEAIEGITPDISNDPSTDLYGAVIKATEISEALLQQSLQDEVIGASSIVLFTDGTDQAGRYSEAAALSAVNDASLNISYFTIGLGSEIDTNILEEIGKTFSAFAGNEAELEATFNEISQRVSERANSFYLFEYCSPKRDGSGENNLVIQVATSNQEGAVQTSFDATGFMAGCQ